jgi:anti-sigma-K factor RskA
VLLGSFDRKLADRLAGEFAPFVLCVADGAFVAQHIEPGTDLRQTFSLLRRALAALTREIIASTAHEGGR